MGKRTIFKLCLVSISFLLMLMGFAKAQFIVCGIVTDVTTGETLPGVNISLSGTTTCAISDLEGNFSFEVPDASAELVFTNDYKKELTQSNLNL
jgi:TonB-dependent starch-binding outer membrane protein SusC